MCSLRDAATGFQDLDVRVFALSLDDVASLKAFHEAQELNFQLLSDPDGSVARKYGVLSERGYANRVTFVLDEKGVLRAVEDSVDVSKHGADLVAKIAEMRG